MNTQERNIALFTRVANYIVEKHTSDSSSSINYEYVQQLVNNMQLINHKLLSIAVRVINKASSKEDVDVEQLTMKLKQIINGSVSKYAGTV